MYCEAFEDQLFMTSDMTTQDWCKCCWMRDRMIAVYNMHLDYEFPMEFMVLEPQDPTPARTIRDWYMYQDIVYDREMRKAVPFANPQWKDSEPA